MAISNSVAICGIFAVVIGLSSCAAVTAWSVIGHHPASVGHHPAGVGHHHHYYHTASPHSQSFSQAPSQYGHTQYSPGDGYSHDERDMLRRVESVRQQQQERDSQPPPLFTAVAAAAASGEPFLLDFPLKRASFAAAAAATTAATTAATVTATAAAATAGATRRQPRRRRTVIIGPVSLQRAATAAGYQPSKSRPQGSCSSLKKVYIINVTSAADFAARASLPPTTTVILYLRNDLTLPRGLFFRRQQSCTILMSAKWPGYTLTGGNPMYPVLRVWNTNNFLSLNVNYKLPVTERSPECTTVPELGKGVTCPAISIHRAYGVQIGKGNIFGRVDVLRSMGVRLDSLKVTGVASFDKSPGVIRVALCGYGPSLLQANIVISNNEVYGVNTPIVLHRGAVGVTVTNNYIHDYIFAGIRCGADVHYSGDCMLTRINSNLVISSGRNLNGDYDSAGIYYCTHWFNPGNSALCNYVFNGDHCYYLDYCTSGVLVRGGACVNTYDGMKVNNGKRNVIKHVAMKGTQGSLGWTSCLTVTVNNCLKDPGDYWERMRVKYYNSDRINRLWPWMKNVCKETSANGGVPCNPPGQPGADVTGACSGLGTDNLIDVVAVNTTDYDYETAPPWNQDDYAEPMSQGEGEEEGEGEGKGDGIAAGKGKKAEVAGEFNLESLEGLGERLGDSEGSGGSRGEGQRGGGGGAGGGGRGEGGGEGRGRGKGGGRRRGEQRRYKGDLAGGLLVRWHGGTGASDQPSDSTSGGDSWQGGGDSSNGGAGDGDAVATAAAVGAGATGGGAASGDVTSGGASNSGGNGDRQDRDWFMREWGRSGMVQDGAANDGGDDDADGADGDDGDDGDDGEGRVAVATAVDVSSSNGGDSTISRSRGGGGSSSRGGDDRDWFMRDWGRSGMVQDAAEIDRDVAAAVDDSASNGGDDSREDRDWFTREWGHSGMVQDGSATNGGDGDDSDADDEENVVSSHAFRDEGRKDNPMATVASAFEAASAGADVSYYDADYGVSSQGLRDEGREQDPMATVASAFEAASGGADDTAAADYDDNYDYGVSGQGLSDENREEDNPMATVASAFEAASGFDYRSDSSSSSGDSNESDIISGDRSEGARMVAMAARDVAEARTEPSLESTKGSSGLGPFTWPLDVSGTVDSAGAGDAYNEDGYGGVLDAAAVDGADTTERSGSDYKEDVVKEESDNNGDVTERGRDYMALAAKDVSFALIPRGSSPLDEKRGGKGDKEQWNKEGAAEGGVGGAEEGSVKEAKGGSVKRERVEKMKEAEGWRVEGAAAGRVEGAAAAAGGGFKRHPNTPMQPQRSSSSSKQSSGQGSRGATKQRLPAKLKGPVPFPFTILPPTTNPMAGILTWPVTSVQNSNSAGDTSPPPSSSQNPSPSRQPAVKRPKGGCTSLRAVYVLNITTPADFNLRLQIPPNVTVVMYLQNNLVLSSGLVFGVGFSCSLLMSTVGMWPGYTIEYPGSDMPAFKVENASNIVSVNVNWKVGVAPGSAACVGFQGADKTSVCPAIAIHRSYGVQVGAPPSVASPATPAPSLSSSRCLPCDPAPSLSSSRCLPCDPCSFPLLLPLPPLRPLLLPSPPPVASPMTPAPSLSSSRCLPCDLLSPSSSPAGHGLWRSRRGAEHELYGRVDVVRSMNVRVDSLKITAPSLPSVASPAHIRVALSGIGPSLLKSNVLITNNEVYNARIGIVLHRGAVGVAVASNYVHGFTSAGIMCGAGPRFVGDCMLVNVSNNVVQAPWGAMPGAGKAIGIVFSTHWINPGNIASCNYVVNGALCYDLDAQSSGVLVWGGACMYAKQGVRINNGKM
ncbi:unnamed protein product [Closterium sp. NIES-65]|nr:unnamed protein product [Closterium sp. NIES-65]